jgi:uncharacterized membrane protein
MIRSMWRQWSRFAAGLALGLVGACGGEEAAPPPAEPAAQEVTEPELRGPIRAAGLLLIGEGVVEFQSCDGGPPLWLDGPLAIDLQELHAELAPGVEPFEGIFIDVVANVGPPPAVGPGTAYDGALIVLLLRRAALEGWNCGDDDPTAILGASGTEPFWSLSVTTEGAEFATPEGRIRLDLGELTNDEEGWVMQGTSPDGGNVFVSLVEIPCRDAMSGAYSHLSAEVQSGGQAFRGCAWLGPVFDPDAA